MTQSFGYDAYGNPTPATAGYRFNGQRYDGSLYDLRARCYDPGRGVFLSQDPLLGPLEDLDLSGIDWLFVGGESGPTARPMKEEWALSLRDQCRRAGVAFTFHQWGGADRYARGRTLDGREWDEMPPAYHTYRPPAASSQGSPQLSLFGPTPPSVLH